MKKLILLTLTILCISFNAYAGKITIDPYILMPTGENITGGYGLQGRYVFDSGFYPYLSYDLNHTDYLDSNMGIVNLASFGGGWTKTWSKRKHGFTFFADGGYYTPHNSSLERTEYSTRKQKVEVKNYSPYKNYPRCIKKYIKPVYVDVVDVSVTKIEYKAGFGGKVGLGYSYAFNPKFSMTLSPAYRYLKLDKEVNGRGEKEDFSAFIGMITFRVRF